MTSTLLDQPRRVGTDGSLVARPGDGRPTLEERLQGAWRGLQAGGAADCPICGDRMTLRGGAGECGGCGSSLT
jgi:hypothetical protein